MPAPRPAGWTGERGYEVDAEPGGIPLQRSSAGAFYASLPQG